MPRKKTENVGDTIDNKKPFFFPSAGTTVMAASLEEAQEILALMPKPSEKTE